VSEQSKDLRERLAKRLGPEKLQERMEELRKEAGGLLDGKAILALVADEQGLTETQFAALAELDPARPVFTRCRIDDIEPVRQFQGRERAGKLRKLNVSDGTGSMVLTLWDEETGLVEQLGLRPGALVRILAATLRETRFGREIHVGKTGFLLAEEARNETGPSEPRNIADLGNAPGRVDVKGVILSLSVTGRGRQKQTTIRLFDGTGECGLIIPHEQLPPPPGLAQGVEVELASVIVERPEAPALLRCDRRSGLKII